MQIAAAWTITLSALLACGLSYGFGESSKVSIDDETYRPQFHFTPAQNWMNDPNGPVFYHGEYHLFFQHNPVGNQWGHMSWGQAVSRDMVHWRRLPLAIPEQNGIMIFSGSTVVDWQNTSGFCKASGSRNPSCLVAIYTGHTDTLQTQNLAYSSDNGRTWTKYSGNPVVDLHLRDFRDPKVFWHAPSHKWIMITALATQHKLRFFASNDLRHWSFLSDFGPAGSTDGVWECPDLFQLPVENEPGQSRWLLSVNLNPGGVAGGSGDQYFIGRFDGSTFTSEGSREQVLWADYGKDFYASTSFSDLPKSDGRRIWLGWLDNWDYAAKEPTSPWRGAQSIPRELRLKRFPEGIRLIQQPVRELQSLRHQHYHMEDQGVAAANRLLISQGIKGETLEIAAEIDAENAFEIGLKVRKGNNEETVIGVNTKQAELFVDRTRSGNVGFDSKFAGRHAGPIRLDHGKKVRLRIFIDRSSVEVFGNDGECVISERVFPGRASDGVELYAQGEGGRVLRLDVWSLKSVWEREAQNRVPGRLSIR